MREDAYRGAPVVAVFENLLPDSEELIRRVAEPVDHEQIENILNNLAHAPFGLAEDDDFRISVAGAALLLHDSKWLKPLGATLTAHVLKTQIVVLPEGIDLTNGVENEYDCLKLMAGFGLLLKGSDTPEEDQLAFLKTQILFWLIGAPDGHAKNFNVFLIPWWWFLYDTAL